MITETNYDTLLSIAIPATLEEDVLDFLLRYPQWASGFSIVDADGMGQGASLRSAMEKVQGRARRRLVLVAGAEADLHLLISALGTEIRSPDAAWWMTPVTASGRLQ